MNRYPPTDYSRSSRVVIDMQVRGHRVGVETVVDHAGSADAIRAAFTAAVAEAEVRLEERLRETRRTTDSIVTLPRRRDTV